MKYLSVCIFILISLNCLSQKYLSVFDANTKKPIRGVHLVQLNTNIKPYNLDLLAISNKEGKLFISKSRSNGLSTVTLTHTSYESKLVLLDTPQDSEIKVFMEQKRIELPTIVIGDNKEYIPDDEFVFFPESRLKLSSELIVEEFWVQKHEVTVAQYKKFIEETGYQTEVERGLFTPYVLEIEKASKGYLTRLNKIDLETYKKATRTKFEGWERQFRLRKNDSVNWRHDEFGKLRTSFDYPVIHITYNDALAYAKWNDLELPTKEQWMVISDDKIGKGWRRSNSTGIIRSVSNSPIDKKGLIGVYGNVSEYLEKTIVSGKQSIILSPLNTFSSRYSGSTNFLYETDSSILTDLYKYGFRCVRNK